MEIREVVENGKKVYYVPLYYVALYHYTLLKRKGKRRKISKEVEE